MKIIAPNAKYNGVSASVTFRDGVGETADPNLIAWFREHGYTIDETGECPMPLETANTPISAPEALAPDSLGKMDPDASHVSAPEAEKPKRARKGEPK